LNGNNIIVADEVTAGQKLMHTKWSMQSSMIRRGILSRGRHV